MVFILVFICSLCKRNVKINQRRVFLLNLIIEFADRIVPNLVGSLSNVDKGGDLANGSLDSTRE